MDIEPILDIRGTHIFDIEASSRCNLACKFCSNVLLPETGLMTQDTFSRFLGHMRLRPITELSFTGIGEPLLNPLLPAFHAQVKGRYPWLRTRVITNGTLLGPGNLPALLAHGLNTLEVSFNGTDAESYESMMTGAHFKRTIRNIEYARKEIERRGDRTRLQINFIVGENDGPGDIERIKAFWRKKRIRRFRAQDMHDRAGAVRWTGKKPVRIASVGRGCEMFEFFTFVSWKGEVFYCCSDSLRRRPIGNVRSQDLETIWARKRKLLRDDVWPEMCGTCTSTVRHGILTEIAKTFQQDVDEEIAKRRRGPGA